MQPTFTNQLDDAYNKGDVQLRQAVATIMHKISDSLPNLDDPVRMYLAGGMAVNFYTGYRPTGDIDASFSHRLLLPKSDDLLVSYLNADGQSKVVYFDTNYNLSFALIHPDFETDALRVMGKEFQDTKIQLFVLTPVDLALSKVARFEANDKEDIAELAKQKLFTAETLKLRAEEALGYYVGNTSLLMVNLNEALQITERAQRSIPKNK
jgi:hypothetical protein